MAEQAFMLLPEPVRSHRAARLCQTRIPEGHTSAIRQTSPCRQPSASSCFLCPSGLRGRSTDQPSRQGWPSAHPFCYSGWERVARSPSPSASGGHRSPPPRNPWQARWPEYSVSSTAVSVSTTAVAGSDVGSGLAHAVRTTATPIKMMAASQFLRFKSHLRPSRA